MDSPGQSELAAVGRAVRAAYVRDPAPRVADAHIAAILAEAERVAAAGADVPAPARRRQVGGRGRLAIRLAAVVASAFVASAGLAIAGVRPPEPFSDVFEGLGFDVPGSDNPRAEENAPAKDGPAGSAPQPGGHAPDAGDARSSGGAGGGELGDRRSDQGDEASSEGRETADEAQGGSTPPSEPGRSEDHPSAPADPASQGQTEGGGPPAEAPAGGPPAEQPTAEPPVEPPPEPLINPETDGPGNSGGAGYSATAPGLATSADHQPPEQPDDGEDAVDPAS